MTEATRREQIERALKAHRDDKDAERREFSLSRGTVTLPVVRIPLAVPVLNTKSFRIAPSLVDHPDAKMVAAEPDSEPAQKVIADLVRSGHSNAVALRQSLQEDGQQEPGVITRSGILINANTRCVLMRDLLHDGKLRGASIKVAVLPDDVTPSELYDLEAVLQKQADLKDPYDLVSELMMFKTLNVEGGMSEQQIAQRQRTTATYVIQGFRILDLMERARHLQDPPIKIKEFGGAKSQRENWKSILATVSQADASGHKEAGDEVLRQFMALHILGSDNVHGIRSLSPEWVDDHLLEALSEAGDVGAQVAEALKAVAEAEIPAEDTRTEDAEANLDLLDFASDNDQPTTGSLGKALLDLTVSATAAGLGTVELPDGTAVPATDVIEALKGTSTAVMKDSENKLSAGKKVDAPALLFGKTHEVAAKANKSLAKVVGTADFASKAAEVSSLLDDITTQVKEARRLLKSSTQS